MRYLLRCYWISFIIILIGCGLTSHLGLYRYTHFPTTATTPVIFPVYIDKNFGGLDQLSIADALDQWNFVFNGHAKFAVVDDHFNMDIPELQQAIQQNAFIIFRIDSHNPLVPTNTDPGFLSVGFTPHLGSHLIYLIRDRLENEDVRDIIMHELGHALGADHTSHGLMYKHYTQEEYQCIDLLTVEQIAPIQHWPLTELNYCILGAMAESPDNASREDNERGNSVVDIVRR